MSSFRSMSRQPQLQTYTNIHKRPTFRGPQPIQQQYRKNMSVASSSVYDPDESAQRNVKLTLKQAITLITLRLGRLEVFANESKFGGIKIDSENSVDKDFLMSLVTRMDNMEKSYHNLRVEVEKNRQTILSLNEALENLDIQDDPIILEIIEKLDNLSTFIETKTDASIFESNDSEVQEVPEVTEVQEVLEVQEVPEVTEVTELPVIQEVFEQNIESVNLESLPELPEKIKGKKRGKKITI